MSRPADVTTDREAGSDRVPSPVAVGAPALHRRGRNVVVVVVMLAMVAGGTWLMQDRTRGNDAAGAPPVPTETAKVTKRKLADRLTVDGTLGYGSPTSLVNDADGRVTGLRQLGTVVRRGGVLYRVDDNPVVLLYGRLPQWRDLYVGSYGRDVRQLETNLAKLGFDPGVVDNAYTSATASAVYDWQEQLGVDETGTVPLGLAIFRPGPVRIAEHLTDLGAQVRAGAPVVRVTGVDRLVTVELDARQRTLVEQGMKVHVELPSGAVVAGTVTSVGKVATQVEGSETALIDVVVRLDNDMRATGLDQAPVQVLVDLESKTALAVPVKALLARSAGGYAVEVVKDGRRRMVPVKTGLFADGYVEISGRGIREGVRVVVPS